MLEPFYKKASPKTYYKLMFLLLAVLMGILTAIMLSVFVFAPMNPISDYPHIAALPTKYLAIILIGGLGKDFMLGYLTSYYYTKWREYKNVK